MNAVAEQEIEKEVAVPKKKAKVSHIDDMFVQIVQDIGGLTPQELLESIPKLLTSADENYFVLGGRLKEISAKEYYKSAGYETFRDYVENVYGHGYRRAMYWIQTYDKLIESGVPWSKVSTVGWTKLKDLASILTPENVDEWVERAKNLTVLNLQLAIAAAKSKTLPTSGVEPTDSQPSKVTTMTFKVHEEQKVIIDQAIEKAMKEANTEFRGVALEGICMNYVSGGNVTVPSLASTLGKYTPEDALLAMEEAFPDVQIKVIIKGKN
jgi:hypothetical protein